MNRQERIVRFQANICEECRLCSDFKNENFDPEFCFEKFENDGAIFIEDVYPKLLLVGANLGRQGVQEKDLLYAFCDTAVCFMGDTAIAKACPNVEKCLRRLQEQANKMSKRKNKHRQNKPKKFYSENQFKGIICEQCGICPDNAGPEFCYNDVYKHNPKKFMEILFPRLLKMRENYAKEEEHISHMDKDEFKQSICRSRVCFDEIADCDECCDSSDCYDTFMDQTCGIIVFGGKVKKTHKEKKNKKKKAYVPVPYATFFSSSRQGFQEEIQRILYGNNIKKQNKDKEVPGELAAEINSGSTDGEPEVPRSTEAGA